MKLECLDFLGISEHFTEEELMVQKTANEFVSKEIMPIIDEHFSKGTFPFEQIDQFSKLGNRLGADYIIVGTINKAFTKVVKEESKVSEATAKSCANALRERRLDVLEIAIGEENLPNLASEIRILHPALMLTCKLAENI